MEINTIINGDCLDVMKQFDDESVDLIVTDPPYKVTPKGGWTSAGGMLKTDMYKKGHVFKHDKITPDMYAPEFHRVLKNGSHCYVMCNHINLINMLNTFTASGFHFIKSLIWNKTNKIMGLYYMSQFEYILFFRKGKGIPIRNNGQADILTIPQNKTKSKNGKNLHDTEKPVELMKILVENSSDRWNLVLDPFARIGSTCLACMDLNRNYIGIEIDENYYTIAKSRIESRTRQSYLTD